MFCNQCVIPPFRKNAKAMLAMAEITLPLYTFSCSFYKGDEIVLLLYRQLSQF